MQDTSRAGIASQKMPFDYTHDYAGNRLTRDIPSTLYAGNDQDQVFAYDNLQRLKNFDESTLSGSSITGTPEREQDWTLDQLSNWPNLLAKTNGTTQLDQNRAHNAVNEIDDDNNHANPPNGITTVTGTNWVDPAHDASGNMTTMPQPKSPGDGYSATYDAWNRLVKIEDGMTVVQTNEYDGLNQRIQKIVGTDTIDYYYNDKWQVIVEAKNGTAEAIYAWHPYYIDALAVRFRANDQHYFLHDANFNVTAAYDVNPNSGTYRQVVERYSYTPYGEVTFLNPDFSVKTTQTSAIGNNYLYTGRERDAETGLQLNRHRFYHPPLGRWLTQDPIGYSDGMNLYMYVRSNPANLVDPMGLATRSPPNYFTEQHQAWRTCLARGPLECGDEPNQDAYVACRKKWRDKCDRDFPDRNGPGITKECKLRPDKCAKEVLLAGGLGTACVGLLYACGRARGTGPVCDLAEETCKQAKLASDALEKCLQDNF